MLISILGVAISFGILIFIHELGHFLAARRLGIKVEKFSIGFGPTIKEFYFWDTKFILSLLPLGGYVKMVGENPDEKLTGSKEEFLSRNNFEKFQVVVMGPVMNIVLAFCIFFIMGLTGKQIPKYYFDNRVYIKDETSKAYIKGIRTKDRIVSINGQKVKNWMEIYKNLNKELNTIVLNVERNGEYHEFIFEDIKKKKTDIGLSEYIEPVIGKVYHDGRAAQSGLKSGDRILSIDDKKIIVWDDVAEIIHGSSDEMLTMKILRNNNEKEIIIVPEHNPEFNMGMIGIEPEYKITYSSLPEAFVEAGKYTLRGAQLIYTGLKMLVTDSENLKYVSGPIGIIKYTSRATHEGIRDLLWLLAILSINLGIINLLPIPVLDGGHLSMFIVEGVTRKKISLEKKMLINNIGIVILLIIFIFATFNDISKLFN